MAPIKKLYFPPGLYSIYISGTTWGESIEVLEINSSFSAGEKSIDILAIN